MFAAVINQLWRARNLIVFKNRHVSAVDIAPEVLELVINVTAEWKGIPRTKLN